MDASKSRAVPADRQPSAGFNAPSAANDVQWHRGKKDRSAQSRYGASSGITSLRQHSTIDTVSGGITPASGRGRSTSRRKLIVLEALNALFDASASRDGMKLGLTGSSRQDDATASSRLARNSELFGSSDMSQAGTVSLFLMLPPHFQHALIVH